MPSMEWSKLLSKRRVGKDEEIEPPRHGRSAFESDVDRIVFSSSFRRLSKK